MGSLAKHCRGLPWTEAAAWQQLEIGWGFGQLSTQLCCETEVHLLETAIGQKTAPHIAVHTSAWSQGWLPPSTKQKRLAEQLSSSYCNMQDASHSNG